MNKEEYRAGLWKKTSDKGTKYCSGKIKIGANEYYITLFNNDKKGNEKAPDFNIIMRDSVISQEKQESTEKGHKNSESGEIKQQQFVVDDVFTEFGNMLEQEENILPF